jgi:hypothetical protein
MPATVTRPADPKIDRWLRRQPPRVELALRYAARGRFDDTKSSARFNARVDELSALLQPNEDELAAVMQKARTLGAATEQQLTEPKPRRSG